MTFNDNQCYALFYFVQNKSCKDVMADLIDKLIGCGPGKSASGKKVLDSIWASTQDHHDILQSSRGFLYPVLCRLAFLCSLQSASHAIRD